LNKIKKYKLEEARQIVINAGYKPKFESYKNIKEKILIETNEGYKIFTSLYMIVNCQNKFNIFNKRNPFTIENIKLWLILNNVNYNLISTNYKDAISKLVWECPIHNNFEMSWNNMRNGNRCPYCSNRKVKLGFNTIFDTNKWMIELGLSEDDSKKYSQCSNKKVNIKCPNCGTVKQKRINDIYNDKTIGCKCGDGVSFGEKCIYNFLRQLNIDLITEKIIKTKDNKIKYYDFYFRYDKNTYVIETHGIQHYKQSFSMPLEQVKKNDKIKEENAVENNIFYIAIDCRYSNIDWIKNSLLNNEIIKKLFKENIDSIDWDIIESYAIFSNLKKDICLYKSKNINMTCYDISKVFRLHKSTIRNYLIQGNKLGWCVYNPENEKQLGNLKSIKHIKNFRSKKILVIDSNNKEYIYNSLNELERKSFNDFGVVLFNTNISKCIKNNKKYKGYSFKLL